MIFLNKYPLFLVVIVFALTAVVGCESNFKEVQKTTISEFVPSGITEEINLKYTDSGAIKAILISPEMIDYTNVSFPFTEFPKGIDVTLYDKEGKKTFIKSDFATSYKKTSIIDLRGNVVIISQDGQKLETEQLYFDQINNWFFTEKKFRFTDPKGVSNGEGIDFSKDFKVINSQKIAGTIEMKN